MKKIIHLADEHIRDKGIAEIETVCDFIVDTARAETPDLIVSAGDLFDSHEVKADSQAARLTIKTISRLADIAPVAVITGTYRHEGNAPEILRFARGRHPVHVASSPDQIYLFEGGFYNSMIGNCEPDVTLTMIPAITKQFFKTASGIADADQEIAQAMTGLFAGFGAQAADYDAPHVLLWHGGISGARIPSGHVLTGQDIEISTDQIRLAGGGHDFLGCFYPGPIYPVRVDEQECGFWVHELDERDFVACLGHIHQRQQIGGDFGEHQSRHVATPFTRTVRLSADFTQVPVTDGVADLFLDCCNNGIDLEMGIKVAGIRIDIRAWQDEAGKIDKDHIRQVFLDSGAASVDIQITRIPRVQVRSGSVLAAETLADKLIESARLREETVAPEVLEMAVILANTPAEQVLEMVMGGAV